MNDAPIISVPVTELQKLVDLAFEMSNYIAETDRSADRSATGSVYGIEYAHKTIAAVAVRLPFKQP